MDKVFLVVSLDYNLRRSLKTPTSQKQFHDPTAHYQLHVLRCTHIKNQVISGSFTLFSLSSNINGFLKVVQNRTIKSISKRNSNHLIFYMYTS